MATVIISSGAVSSGGSIYGSNVEIYGTASNVLFQNCSSTTVMNGGKAIDTTLEMYTRMTVQSGGIASRTSINSCTLIVLNGGRADSVSFTGVYPGALRVGGSATNIVGNGSVTIASGGETSKTTITNVVYVSSGGNAIDTTLDLAGRILVYKDGNASVTTLLSSSYLVLSGGEAVSTYLAGDYASMAIYSSATASVTHISGGKMYLSSGGEAADTYISGGAMDVYGYARGTYISGGSVTIASGGTAFTVKAYGGIVNVTAGATVRGLSASGGSVAVFNGALLSSANIDSGSLEIRSGGVASETYVGSGGVVSVCGAAAANGTLLSSGGTMNVLSGGIANVVKAYGTLNMSAGAMLTSVSVLGGTLRVHSGAHLSSMAVQDGRIVVLSGGIALANRATKDGRISVGRGGGVASCVAMSSGRIELEGGSALATEVAVGGILLVEGLAPLIGGKSSAVTPGVASNTHIHLGAVASVGSGGVMIDTVVAYSSASLSPREPKLELDIPSILLERAGLYINSGGIASGVTASKGAIVAVASKGRLISARVLSGASAQIMAGGSANTLNVLRGGVASITGSASSVSVASAAHATIASGGAAAGVTVSTGGLLRASAGAALSAVSVESGGTITGRFANLASQTITLADGILDFDISALGADEVCVEQLNFGFGGTYSCTLTVGDSQAAGTYKLAGDAAGFDKTISVQNAAGESLGTLTVGQTVDIGGVGYALKVGGDNALSVSVRAAAPTPAGTAKSDINANGISDVMFQYTGGLGQIGFWLDGTSTWQSTNSTHPVDTWEVLGAYDMNANGKADSVLVGNTEISGIKAAFIGYYTDAEDYDSNWVNISYLTNNEGYVWKNKVGNLTGNDGMNSIVWHSTELGALGVWTDGTDSWVGLGAGYDANWTLVGCGDFTGDGKDAVLMSYAGGVKYYTVGIDGTSAELAASDSGWEVRAIADFAGDRKDDIVAFHKETGIVAMWGDGNSANWSQLGQLDAADWFVVGAGDYDGDAKDDLLVRQYSTGMLGYYASGDMSAWTELGRGVDMSWTVIA